MGLYLSKEKTIREWGFPFDFESSWAERKIARRTGVDIFRSNLSSIQGNSSAVSLAHLLLPWAYDLSMLLPFRNSDAAFTKIALFHCLSFPNRANRFNRLGSSEP